MTRFNSITRYATGGVPFIFFIDFDAVSPVVIPLSDVDSGEILYDFNGRRNFTPDSTTYRGEIFSSIEPVPFDRYKSAFDHVINSQQRGDSYITNLTFPTKLTLNCSLLEIFHFSRARYRLWVKDRFVVFSPETFISISDGIISTFPMKGTINASIPGAREIILNDEKESAEHLTTVDLLRSDLSRVASDVTVERFRYIEKITSGDRELFQVSSQISGVLKDYYRENFGMVLSELLPAGSVTGAPKRKTLDIIREAERYDRGYYTGICGICDGTTLDSGVMIRYIERIGDDFYFKSGGGITLMSDPHSEYMELIAKINVPVA